MDQSILEDFKRRTAAEHYDIYGARLDHDGDAVEWHRRSDYSPECIYSGTKTFVGAGIGIAQAEGLLSRGSGVPELFSVSPISADTQKGNQLSGTPSFRTFPSGYRLCPREGSSVPESASQLPPSAWWQYAGSGKC